VSEQIQILIENNKYQCRNRSRIEYKTTNTSVGTDPKSNRKQQIPVWEQIQNLIGKQQIPVSEQIQNLIENNKYQRRNRSKI
jgi:hypothetical protein